MKKKGTVLAVCMTALIGLTVFAGCGSEEYALSYYHGENKDESGDSVYNEQLFLQQYVAAGVPRSVRTRRYGAKRLLLSVRDFGQLFHHAIQRSCGVGGCRPDSRPAH